jgi:hypothetical protein
MVKVSPAIINLKKKGTEEKMLTEFKSLEVRGPPAIDFVERIKSDFFLEPRVI